MKYLLFTLLACISLSSADACVTVNTDDGTYTIDNSGCVDR